MPVPETCAPAACAKVSGAATVMENQGLPRFAGNRSGLFPPLNAKLGSVPGFSRKEGGVKNRPRNPSPRSGASSRAGWQLPENTGLLALGVTKNSHFS
jgi:hypothetical protein